MDWLSILVNLILTGILLYVFQKIIDERSAKRLEKFKLELFEQETKFSKLHEVRVQVVADVYKKLSDIQNAWDDIQQIDIDYSPNGIKQITNELSKLRKSITEFDVYFIANRIYIPKNLCEKIEEFYLKFKMTENAFWKLYIDPNQRELLKKYENDIEYLTGYNSAIRSVSNGLSDMFNNLLQEIEKELREVIETKSG